MKYCEEYTALLDLFVDGELPLAEMERVRAHLAVCPGCRGYVDDALAIRAGLSDVEDTVVPEGFAGSVMERVRRDAGRSAKTVELKRRSVRRWTGALAALAACCALVILVRTGGSVKSGSVMTAAADLNGDMETAATFAAGPGADPGAAAYDAGESGECGIMPRMAPAESFMNAEGQRAENGATAGKEDTSEYDNTIGGTAGGEGYDASAAGSPVQTEDAAEAAPESGKASEMLGGAPPLLLTGGEARELLDGFSPVWEDAVSSCYNLDAGEYRALLEALGRPAEIRETEEGTFSVLVKWDLE